MELSTFESDVKTVLTIWVPYLCDEFHFGRPERIVFGKREMSFKHSTLTVNTIQHALFSKCRHPSPILYTA